MFKKSFEEMGMPFGYGFKELVFSPVANALVVQMQSAGNSWRPERLYFRQLSSDKYKNIGQPGDLTSQEFPFVHSSKPLLAYNSMQHRFTLDAQGEEQHSGDWNSLKLFNLELGVEIDSISGENLHLPTGVMRGWISDIVTFGDSGLFVKAGLSKDSSRMEYVVAELDVGAEKLKANCEPSSRIYLAHRPSRSNQSRSKNSVNYCNQAISLRTGLLVRMRCLAKMTIQ